MARKVPVWDFPTRAFHWVLVLLIAFSVFTAKAEGDWHAWHERSGVAILILVAFRLVWGFVGGEHARFATFLKGPGAVLGYLRGARTSTERFLGHNPLGGYSVLALLASVGTQAVTGLFADDEIATQGPLAKTASSATVTLMTRIHHINEKVLFVLIALHILAILFYLVKKKENLVRPMITGEKEWDVAVDASRHQGSIVVAAIVLGVVAAIVGTIVYK